MSHNFFLNANFHHHLLHLDEQIAAEIQSQGCVCGGRLHRADYPRQGFGVPTAGTACYEQRFSFCCADCRRRTTPFSVRFFGSRRFISTIFILIAAWCRKGTEPRHQYLARRFGIHLSVRTWKRWRAWWRETFPTTVFWKQARGRLLLAPNEPIVRALLRQFVAPDLASRLILLLQFLAPLSLGSARAG